MDFKWKLSRPGIELEFETGSIGEAIGLLTDEGTQITEVFGFTMGAKQSTDAPSPEGAETPARRTRGPAKPKQEAVAPPPLPVPAAPVATATLPPNPLGTADDGGIPPGLKRDPVTNEAPALLAAPPPLLPAPPLAPLPPTAPPVGVLGPKVVAALELHKEGKQDGGQALADWLASAGLTQKGATYDEACRVVLMTSDSKLTELGIAGAFKVAA